MRVGAVAGFAGDATASLRIRGLVHGMRHDPVRVNYVAFFGKGFDSSHRIESKRMLLCKRITIGMDMQPGPFKFPKSFGRDTAIDARVAGYHVNHNSRVDEPVGEAPTALADPPIPLRGRKMRRHERDTYCQALSAP